MNAMDVAVEFVGEGQQRPTVQQIVAWATAALESRTEPCELSVRVVQSDEIQALNKRYRHQDKPTNVLAFPCDVSIAPGMLGDVVVCSEVVEREAAEQGKSFEAHFAHMIVHGVLHLLGYDHHEAKAAGRMENRERIVLASLGYGDPYGELENGTW